MKLSLYTYDDSGKERAHVWEFTPVGDPEFQIDRRATDTEETDATDTAIPLWFREIRIVKVGAGTLRSDEHKRNLGRCLAAHKIVWHRVFPTGKKKDIEVKVKADSRIAFEFLKGISKLPSIKLTIAEKEAAWYDSFEKFIAERMYVE